MFRTVGDQCSLWESVLPEELQRLPEELARVDALLDDPAFFAPFVPFFDPQTNTAPDEAADIVVVSAVVVRVSGWGSLSARAHRKRRTPPPS
jgi:hypothetical protein